jgi:AmmeMemoRadiSam system protein B
MSEFTSLAQGIFYPSGAQALGDMIDESLKKTHHARCSLPAACILPHAAYEYVLDHITAALGSIDEKPSRIILIQPLHSPVIAEDRPNFIFTPDYRHITTPLGSVPIQRCKPSEHAAAENCYFEEEPGWELLVPIVQRLWPGIAIRPVITGASSAKESAELGTLVGNECDAKSLVIISSNAGSGKDAEVQASAFLEALTRAEAPSLVSSENRGKFSACGKYCIDALYRARLVSHPWSISGPLAAGEHGYSHVLSACTPLSGVLS